MSKRLTALALIALLLNPFLYTTALANNTKKDLKFARKVKAEILKLGTGVQSEIKVKLRDNTKLNGYVGEISEENFTVVDRQTGKATQVSYSQVKKASGRNNLNGTTILIGVLVVWVALIVIRTAIED